MPLHASNQMAPYRPRSMSVIILHKRAMCMNDSQSGPPLHVPSSNDSYVAAYRTGWDEGIALDTAITAAQYFHSGFPGLGPGFVSSISSSGPLGHCSKETHVVLQPNTNAIAEGHPPVVPYLLTDNGSAYLMRDGDGIRDHNGVEEPPYMTPGYSEEVHQVADNPQVSGAGAIIRDSGSAAVDVSRYF